MVALNEEGKKLLKLKETIINVPVDLLGEFLRETPYKKELLDNSISISDFEGILKKDKKFASKEQYVRDKFYEFIDDIEDNTNRAFSIKEYHYYFFIEIYFGMTKGEYLDYTKTTIEELNSNELERNFANRISSRLVESASLLINEYINKNIEIPKCHSKNITVNVKRYSGNKRFLYDNSISLKFPKEYLLEYKNLKKIVMQFLNYTWEGIELYKTWQR